MVDDLTKKGTEGASADGAIVDLSPATVKALPKNATNSLVAAGLAAAVTIGAIAVRSAVDQAIIKNNEKVIAAGGTPKIVNPDIIDGGMIAGGVGMAAMSKNSYFRAAMVGVSSAGLVSLILRKVPRLSAPFARPAMPPATVTEENW